MRLSPGRHINAFARFLSATRICVEDTGGSRRCVIGWTVHFSDGYMLVFNPPLSIAAIVIPSGILVANARSKAAIQVKRGRPIEYSEASNQGYRT